MVHFSKVPTSGQHCYRVSTPRQPWKIAIAENAAEIGTKHIFTKYNILLKSLINSFNCAALQSSYADPQQDKTAHK
jgi:hypothetical protein